MKKFCNISEVVNSTERQKDQVKEDAKNKIVMNEKNIAEVLINLISDSNLFTDGYGNPYATVQVENHKEILEVRGARFKAWIIMNAKDEIGKFVGSSVIKEVIENLASRAIYSGTTANLDIRVSYHNGKIYYDLCNEKWQVIEIDKNGWKVIDIAPRIFKRIKHQKPQVIPEAQKLGGDINKIFDFINIRKDDRLLFLIYLVSCFVPNIPHPMGVFYGEKGAAKTTTFRILKKLIDPSVLETMTFPKNNEELVQVLSHHWYCNFDNLSNINDTISDTLCRAVTGEGYIKRKMYSDEDDVIFTYKRCVGLNGINVVAKKEDLLDRSILFRLERITEENRKAESTVWDEFENERPQILGGIFNTLCKSIEPHLLTRHDKLYRMADFTRWGYAIAQALGGKGDKFIKDYEMCIKKQNQEVIQINPFAASILIFIERERAWTGKASDLLRLLEKIAKQERLDITSSEFPKSSTLVTKKLNQLKGNLNGAGIYFGIKHISTGNQLELVFRTPQPVIEAVK